MANLRFAGTYTKGTKTLEAELSVIQFEEDGVMIVYSPSLDLSGYGKSVKEARESFNEALAEFIRYTLNKSTFEKELRALGWRISGKRSSRKYQQPHLDDLLRDKAYLSDIVREKEFQRFNARVALPA